LSEHHINATPARLPRPAAQPDGSFQIPPEQVRALREFIDRYHVNAIQLPHPDNIVKDPERERRRLRAWLTAWDRAIEATGRPSVVFYFYLLDEPNDQASCPRGRLGFIASCPERGRNPRFSSRGILATFPLRSYLKSIHEQCPAVVLLALLEPVIHWKERDNAMHALIRLGKHWQLW
jgi:hypothetical protein